MSYFRMSKANKGKGPHGSLITLDVCPACKRRSAPAMREPKGGDLMATDVHRARCMWCKAKLVGRYVIRWEQDDDRPQGA